MGQDKKVDQLEEAILDKLPEEAIRKLADLADSDEDYADEAQAILDEYNIDAKKMAQEILEESKNE